MDDIGLSQHSQTLSVLIGIETENLSNQNIMKIRTRNRKQTTQTPRFILVQFPSRKHTSSLQRAPRPILLSQRNPTSTAARSPLYSRVQNNNFSPKITKLNQNSSLPLREYSALVTIEENRMAAHTP